jgi:hypothetical protein
MLNQGSWIVMLAAMRTRVTGTSITSRATGIHSRWLGRLTPGTGNVAFLRNDRLLLRSNMPR